MRVIRKIGEEIKEVNYPSKDINAQVVDLDDSIKFYFIEKKETPIYNPDTSYLKPYDKLIDEPHPDYPHLFICEQGYEVVDYSQQSIIEKLNNAVGEWIESRLPVWKQVKYISRFMYLDILAKEGTATQDQLQEMAYLNDLDNWVIKCREDRDLRENDYINNNVFPSFIFDEIPLKQY